MKNKVISALAVLAGLCFIGWGLLSLSSADDTCVPHGLRKGDTCTIIGGNHSSVTRTKDEQRSVNRRTGMVQIGLGGLLIVGGIWSMFSDDTEPTEDRRPDD